MSFQKYEQYGKIRSLEYIADTVVDLADLPKATMGSTCYVIENATNYMCNSKNEWIPQNKPVDNNSGGTVNPDSGSVDLSNYMTKAEVNAAIAAATTGVIKEDDLKTINGASLIGEGDIELSAIIPDEEIVSEEELTEHLTEQFSIENI